MPKYDPYAAESATIEEAVPQYSMPRGTYAAPSLESGDAYNDEFGWSARLRTSTVETPSAQRLGVIPRFDEYPDPNHAPEDWYKPQDRDTAKRESTTSGQDTLWKEDKGIGTGPRWGRNPRETPPAESRITQQLSPATYSFTRPFDQLNRTYGDVVVGSARQFNGTHFSMADHERTTIITAETAGSMPVRSLRNTYRIEPPPWDTNIVDYPDQTSVGARVITTYNVAPRARNYRL